MHEDQLSLHIETTPIPQQRHRFSKEFGHAYDPSAKDKRHLRNLIIVELKKLNLQESPFLDKPISVRLEFGFIKPKSAKKRIHHNVKPDIDNLSKFVLDAANKLLFRDDAIITDLSASKVYAEQEYIKIHLETKKSPA